MAQKAKGGRYTPPKKRLAERSLPAELQAVYDAAPDVPAWGGKWMVYGLCTWWSSDPSTMGRLDSTGVVATGLPCCPNCSSPLRQAPLLEALHEAAQHPERYGTRGLPTFLASQNAECRRDWPTFEVEVVA